MECLVTHNNELQNRQKHFAVKEWEFIRKLCFFHAEPACPAGKFISASNLYFKIKEMRFRIKLACCKQVRNDSFSSSWILMVINSKEVLYIIKLVF